MRLFVIPLLVLVVLSSYFAGLGIAARWQAPFPLEYVVAGALHAAWVLAITRRSSPTLAVVCWSVTVWLTRVGFAARFVASSYYAPALVLDGICLLLALAVAPAQPWAERLAHWRRARADIAAQLRMGQGIVPWLRLCLGQFATGSAYLPAGSEYQQFAARLADTEHRLRIRISRAVLPEQLRQSILENVSAIVARAEITSARYAVELEQQALIAAAVCREQCERMEGLSVPERTAMVSQCEQLFLELTRH
jgi:hypothetical protein